MGRESMSEPSMVWLPDSSRSILLAAVSKAMKFFSLQVNKVLTWPLPTCREGVLRMDCGLWCLTGTPWDRVRSWRGTTATGSRLGESATEGASSGSDSESEEEEMEREDERCGDKGGGMSSRGGGGKSEEAEPGDRKSVV